MGLRAPLAPCPFKVCRQGRLSVMSLGGLSFDPTIEPLFKVVCRSCGASGPAARSDGEARRFWNERVKLFRVLKGDRP